jgi:hypothetical protein
MSTRGKSLPGKGRSHECLSGFFLFLFCFDVCHSSEGFRKRFLFLFLDESISPKSLSESKSQLIYNYFRVVKLPIGFGKPLALSCAVSSFCEKMLSAAKNYWCPSSWMSANR